MRCIWQMDGDKVKGFKCEFSPIDMLMIVSGLKYIVADIERHPKDRERAQGIYNRIMLCRYYDEADHKDEPSDSEIPNKCEDCIWSVCNYNKAFKDEPTISKMEQVDKDINVRSKDEPQNCDTCRHYFGKDFDIECEVKAFGNECRYEPKDEPQTERSE